MASLEECLAAAAELAARLDAVDPDLRKARTPDRTLSLHVTDLDQHLHGRLHEGSLVDIEVGADPQAQLKGSLSSDDLLALTDKSLRISDAIVSGRLKVQASWRDLLELRRFV